MNPALQNLRDIHLTEPAGWWPLAMGWWIVIGLGIALVMAALLFALWRWRRNRTIRRLRRSGTRQLQQIQRLWENHQDDALLIRNLGNYLRRMVKQIRPSAASLTGEAWLRTLNELGNTDRFTSDSGALFGDQIYAPAPNLANENNALNGQTLISLCADWQQRCLNNPQVVQNLRQVRRA